MHNISQLEKQQVGLRLPKYLLEEIDNFTTQFSINRTDIITEAISSYISEQKKQLFYANFRDGCEEIKTHLEANSIDTLPSLETLINELEHKDS